MFSVSGSGPAMVLESDRLSRSGKAAPQRMGGQPGGETDEVGGLERPEPAELSEAEQQVRQRAKQIAARLSLRHPRHGAGFRRGSGDIRSLRYRGTSDELDLDRTLEVLSANPWPEDEDIIVRERIRTRRSVVVIVDISGSMKGERLNTAAATVGALSAELANDDVSFVAFWSDAAVLVPMGAPFTSATLLDILLRLPAQGLTNVGHPLEVAAVQLARKPSPDARVLLLSDCVHNAGPDPRAAAARLPRLDVLLDASGEKDVDLGHDLARAGRGRLLVVNTHRDVAPALTRIFTA